MPVLLTMREIRPRRRRPRFQSAVSQVLATPYEKKKSESFSLSRQSIPCCFISSHARTYIHLLYMYHSTTSPSKVGQTELNTLFYYT